MYLWYFVSAFFFGFFSEWPGPVVLPMMLGLKDCIDIAIKAKQARKFYKNASIEIPRSNLATGDFTIKGLGNLFTKIASGVSLGHIHPLLYLWQFLYGTLFTLVLSLIAFLIKKLLSI